MYILYIQVYKHDKDLAISKVGLAYRKSLQF